MIKTGIITDEFGFVIRFEKDHCCFVEEHQYVRTSGSFLTGTTAVSSKRINAYKQLVASLLGLLLSRQRESIRANSW